MLGYQRRHTQETAFAFNLFEMKRVLVGGRGGDGVGMSFMGFNACESAALAVHKLHMERIRFNSSLG